MPQKNPTSIPVHLDLLPEVLAAGLAEQEAYSVETITIHPMDGTVGGQHREVLEARFDKHRKALAIRTRSKSSYRREIEQQFSPNSPARPLLEEMEREMTFFRIQLTLRERAHLLGLSSLQPHFFEMPAFLDAEQRCILAFFLPYRVTIQKDLVLTEKCFCSALGQAVRINRCHSKSEQIKGTATNHSIVNGASTVGGIAPTTAPCASIEIGPLPLQELANYVPGGRQRRFLEEALLPAFLPSGWDWQITVMVAEAYRQFRISSEEQPLRIDINSYINP